MPHLGLQGRRGRQALASAWIAVCLMTGLSLASAVAAPTLAEQKLIEALIRDVGNAHDTVFIRNGKEYDAKEAAAHLHEKYVYFRGEITTADDFIRLCATRSELTGRPYHVREPSGQVRESAAYLGAHLAELRSAVAASAVSPAAGASGPAPAATKPVVPAH